MVNIPAVIDLAIVSSEGELNIPAEVAMTIEVSGGNVPADIPMTIDVIGGSEETVAAEVILTIDMGSSPGNGNGDGNGGDDSESWIERYWWTLAIVGVVLLGVGIYLLVRYWPERGK